MKKLIIGLAIFAAASPAFAQVQTTPPPGNPGATQMRPSYPTTTPGTNTINNNGNNPANGTAPGSTFPGTNNPYPSNTTPYPGTNTTNQPGMNTPGTGTAPRTGTTTTPFRTYSDKNNLINNSPNPTPASPNPAVGNPTINGR